MFRFFSNRINRKKDRIQQRMSRLYQRITLDHWIFEISNTISLEILTNGDLYLRSNKSCRSRRRRRCSWRCSFIYRRFSFDEITAQIVIHNEKSISWSCQCSLDTTSMLTTMDYSRSSWRIFQSIRTTIALCTYSSSLWCIGINMWISFSIFQQPKFIWFIWPLISMKNVS